jgi:hypothetical protein
MNRRSVYGFAALLVVLGLVVFEPGSAPVAIIEAASRPGVDLAPPPSLLALEPRPGNVPATDAFAPRNWNPPPSPPAAEPARVAVPPPLTFRCFGKHLEGDRWRVFLSRGEQVFHVGVGDVIEGRYRIDRIEPPNMLITYLPLRHQQRIDIGGLPP